MASTGTRLAAERSRQDLAAFNIHSLNDEDFMFALSDPSARSASISVPIREDNIRRTCNLSTVVKEINTAMKLGNRQRVIDYLHSLDDRTLSKLSRNDVIRGIISDNVALSHRYANIAVNEAGDTADEEVLDLWEKEEPSSPYKPSKR